MPLRPRSLARTLALLALPILPLSAQTGSGVVSSQSDVFRAGGNGPTLDGQDPFMITLPGSGPFWTMTFTASGSWNPRWGLDPWTGPDGGFTGNPGTNINSWNSISGIAGPYNMWLTGVFLGPTLPPTAPPRLVYSNFSAPTYTSLQLGQVFFIGDGLTGNGSGAVQQFGIPTGATRLFLGLVDGSSFQGNPGQYYDNLGSMDVSWTIVGPSPQTPGDVVPEPATITLLALGLVPLLIGLKVRAG